MEFVVIKSYPNYEISNSGVVRNIKTGKTISVFVGDTGYFMVNVNGRVRRVHRLLAETFIPNPNNYDCINHIDGVKLNNCLSNLEWCTRTQNMQHGWENGLIESRGEGNGKAVLTNEQVVAIKKLLNLGLTQQRIADEFSVSRSCIAHINQNRRWKHLEA